MGKKPLDLGELLTGFVCEAELHEPLVSYADFFFLAVLDKGTQFP